MKSDIPGRELGKEFREVARRLVLDEGWRYDNGSRRGGHPILYPADHNQPRIVMSSSPSDKKRAIKNFLADVRRRGGLV